MENKKKKKEKIDFKKKKENTISSLFEIEKFLRNTTKVFNGFKFIKKIK